MKQNPISSRLAQKEAPALHVTDFPVAYVQSEVHMRQFFFCGFVRSRQESPQILSMPFLGVQIFFFFSFK